MLTEKEQIQFAEQVAEKYTEVLVDSIMKDAYFALIYGSNNQSQLGKPQAK